MEFCEIGKCQCLNYEIRDDYYNHAKIQMPGCSFWMYALSDLEYGDCPLDTVISNLSPQNEG